MVITLIRVLRSTLRSTHEPSSRVFGPEIGGPNAEYKKSYPFCQREALHPPHNP